MPPLIYAENETFETKKQPKLPYDLLIMVVITVTFIENDVES